MWGVGGAGTQLQAFFLKKHFIFIDRGFQKF